MRKRRTLTVIMTVFMLLAASTMLCAQDKTPGNGLSLGELERMPLKVIEKSNGEKLLQRNRSDIERIISGMAGRELGSEERLWADYLEKPHPNVKMMHRFFAEASQEFNVPVELLQAIGQVESNWTQMGPSIDQGWGIMHLVQNSYVDTLGEAASLLEVSLQTLKDDAQQNIRGAAALLAQYAKDEPESFRSIEDWFPAVKRFSALDGDELQTMQAERYFEVLRNGVKKPTLWNEYITLSAQPAVNLKSRSIAKQPTASADYGPARSYYYSNCTYTPGRTRKLDTWVNHWIGYGTYAGAISYLSRCDIKASAHFVIKQNGEITQTVRVRDTAWHAGAYGYPNNPRSIGVEHEAVVTDPSSWNHPAMLKASAKMARYFADKYGIPKKRALPGVRGHNEMPGTSTQCPGNLPWGTWMNYFLGSSPAAPKLTGGLWVHTNNPSSQSIEYGQWMDAGFKVKNFGGKAITFKRIGVGGRAPSSNGGTNPTVVCDLGWQTNVTLQPNQEKSISISTDHYGCNKVSGTYQLSAYYQLSDNSWHKIPTGVSGTRTDVNFKIVQHASASRLSNGVIKSDYVPRKGYDHFYIDIPANTTKLVIASSGARSGNYLNLYEKSGSTYPTTSSYSNKATGSSSNETLTIMNPAAGRHTILVDGYYNGGSERGTPYKITASWENPTEPASKSLSLISNPGTDIEGLSQNAVAAWQSPYWNSSLVNSPQGTTWIWSSYYTTPAENQYGATRNFLEPFSIPQGAQNIQGTIEIAADDRFTLYLNGSKFAENGDHRYIRRYNFTPKVGRNVLKIAAWSQPGPIDPKISAAGVIYRANVSYDLAHRMTVKRIGDGTVTGVGINCGTDCSEEYGDGAGVTFTATPEHGATFSGWSGACTGTGDCTVKMDAAKNITATFSGRKHTITAGAGPGGAVSPSGFIAVSYGESQSFTIEPDTGYQIASMLVDGKTVNNASSYTFANVTADHSLKVYFKKAVHTIMSSEGAGGSISPEGAVAVVDGANQSFTIVPDAGYRILDVQVDNASIGTVPLYTFSKVHADRSISASFEKIPAEAVSLSLEDAEAKPGATGVPVTVSLENAETAVNSMQFRVKYDAGKGLQAIDGSAGYRLTDRPQGFSVAVSSLGSGANSELLVLLYNLSGAGIATGSGPVLELLFNVDATAEPGDTIPLTFTESVVSDAEAQAIPSINTDTGLFTILQAYDLGDINADGAINVLDLQLLINCIKTAGSCERGDMNGDGLYNVLDVQLLINTINNTVSTGTGASHGEPATTGSDVNVINLPTVELQAGTTGTFGIELLNEHPVASGQMTLMYDSTSGVELTGVSLTDRTQGFYEPVFYQDASDPANVKVFVMFFSLDGTVIEPGIGEILEVSYQTAPDASGDIGMAFTDVLLATLDGENYPAPVTPDNGGVSIYDPSLHTLTATAGTGGRISPDGVTRLKSGSDQTFTITADEGYHIEDVRVDGLSVGAVAAYTLLNINADHLVEAEFASDTETSSSYFGFEEHGGIWNDANKTAENPDDDWMCWAAAAANILEWSEWGTDMFNTAQEIFAHFQDSWTDAGGLMQYGWNWWFDGTAPQNQAGWATLNDGVSDSEGNGNYWREYDFFEYFQEDWASYDSASSLWSAGSGLMQTVADYLHDGLGTTLAIYSETGGHALSVWGYEYDEQNQYTGIWVSDSDDNADELKMLSLLLDEDTGLWYLDSDNLYDYNGWFIGGVQALAQNPQAAVPEPGTLLLLGAGIIGIMMQRRKRPASRQE